MYAIRSVRGSISAKGSSVAQRDAWILAVANFAHQAGWDKLASPPSFVIETTLDALSYIGFGGNPANDIFWKITNLTLGGCYMVIDGPGSGGRKGQTCGLGVSLDISNPPQEVDLIGSTRFVKTNGSVLKADVHRGVVLAILLTMGVSVAEIQAGFAANNAFDGSLIKVVPISNTKSTIILKTIVSNDGPFFDIGASLRTSSTAPLGGGFVLTSQSSTRTVLKSGIPTTYGASNFLAIYLTQAAIGPNQFLVVAASKLFSSYAFDTPEAPSGIGSLSGFRTAWFGMDSSVPTIGFASPYSIILHNDHPTPGAVKSFAACALKLPAWRRDSTQDLNVQEALFFCTGGGSTGLRTIPYFNSGPMMVSLNNVGRFNPSGENNSGTPQLVINYSSRGFGVSGSVPWRQAAAPKCEPWVAFNNRLSNGKTAIVGQIWDMITEYQGYSTPDLDPFGFPWDGQVFQPYTKGHPNTTSCFRFTESFTG